MTSLLRTQFHQSDIVRRSVATFVVAVALIASTLGQSLVGAAPNGPPVSVVVSRVESADGAVVRAIRDLGGRIEQNLPIVEGFAAVVPASAVSALRSVPGVRAVVPNANVQMHGQYGEGSGVASAVYSEAVRAPQAWSAGWGGQGVGVAIIDTGINATGDLAGKVAHAEDFTAEHDNVDGYGHGTFVAGLIAGSGAGSNGAVQGVAPGSHLVSVKIAGRDGSTDVVRLLAALQWVVTFKDVYGIRVLNLSLGVDSAQDYRTDPLNFAIERVWNAGIVVVTAAGNGGTASGTIAKPGDDPLVITAGAADDHTTPAQDDDTLAAFSGTGPTASNGLAKPDLLAPGKSVISLRSPGSTIDVGAPGARIGDAYFKGSGTSFSSAITAGTAALVLSRTPQLTPNQVKGRLAATGRRMPDVPPASAGAGELDAGAAVSSDVVSEANTGVVAAGRGGALPGVRSAACGRTDTGSCPGDAAAAGARGFNATEYFGSQWAGSQWAGSQWAAGIWS
ncbi:MAG TPA: S8 family peptidase [Acidimicrobiales bacterium]|nr:S8 family peptidase [Acidimicrobiales bacterium]